MRRNDDDKRTTCLDHTYLNYPTIAGKLLRKGWVCASKATRLFLVIDCGETTIAEFK